jgi:hypothetical protein
LVDEVLSVFPDNEFPANTANALPGAVHHFDIPQSVRYEQAIMRGLEDIFKRTDIELTRPIFALGGAQSLLCVQGFSSQGTGSFRSNGMLPQRRGSDGS